MELWRNPVPQGNWHLNNTELTYCGVRMSSKVLTLFAVPTMNEGARRRLLVRASQRCRAAYIAVVVHSNPHRLTQRTCVGGAPTLRVMDNVLARLFWKNGERDFYALAAASRGAAPAPRRASQPVARASSVGPSPVRFAGANGSAWQVAPAVRAIALTALTMAGAPAA